MYLLIFERLERVCVSDLPELWTRDYDNACFFVRRENEKSNALYLTCSTSDGFFVTYFYNKQSSLDDLEYTIFFDYASGTLKYFE